MQIRQGPSGPSFRTRAAGHLEPQSLEASLEVCDFHHTAADVQMGREFALDPEFEAEVSRASGDGMVKIKIGVLAVSQHHQALALTLTLTLTLTLSLPLRVTGGILKVSTNTVKG